MGSGKIVSCQTKNNHDSVKEAIGRVKTEKDASKLPNLLNSLYMVLLAHVQAEEKIMVESNYSKSKEHLQSHSILLENLESLIKRLLSALRETKKAKILPKAEVIRTELVNSTLTSLENHANQYDVDLNQHLEKFFKFVQDTLEDELTTPQQKTAGLEKEL